MSSGFIPKEKLSAYERWELAAFDEGEGRGGLLVPTVEPEAPAEPAAAPTTADGIPLPTAEEIERIHNDAYATGLEAGREAGHAEGRAEGFEAGHAEGLKKGMTEARAEAEKFMRLADNLRQSLGQLDQEVAEDLLSLAIDIAGQVIRQSLRVRPELLLPVVREALASLPPHHGHPALHLHPSDAALVRNHLGEQLTHNGWRIVEDDTVTTGGCRVTCGASEVDATIETRWRRVLDSLGSSGEWLESGSRG